MVSLNKVLVKFKKGQGFKKKKVLLLLWSSAGSYFQHVPLDAGPLTVKCVNLALGSSCTTEKAISRPTTRHVYTTWTKRGS